MQNIAHIVDQIDHAADLATTFMRTFGRILSPGRPDVPLQDEVDLYLRGLVCEAFAGWEDAKAEAASDHQAPPPWEIDGYASDDRLFDIVITGLLGVPGALKLQVLLRLV